MVSERGRLYYSVRPEGIDARPCLQVAEVERETMWSVYFVGRPAATDGQRGVWRSDLAGLGLATTPEEAIRLYVQPMEDRMSDAERRFIRAQKEYSEALAAHEAALMLANQYGVSLKTEGPDGE